MVEKTKGVNAVVNNFMCPKGTDSVLIQGGKFVMGENDSFPERQPAHSVEVSTFCLQTTEVPNRKFDGFRQALIARQSSAVAVGGRKEDDPVQARARFAGPDQPAVYVSWNDAKEYCESIGGRLPTEAEWEYAATEGGKKEYPTASGEIKADEANFAQDVGTGKGTINVGSLGKPTSWGLHDMAGNVFEWVEDTYKSYYEITEVKDPKVTGDGWKIQRGGCWINSNRDNKFGNALQARGRSSRPVEDRAEGTGFRCVFDAVKKQ